MSVAEPVVVLVEGRSDVAAVITFMRSAGINAGEPVDVIDMGGVTNIRRHLEHFTAPGRARRILGLCDAGDAGVFLRALQAREIPVNDPDGMARYGFHVSRADLEDELIRSLGTDAVLGVLTDLGLRERFEGLRRQRYWRDRDLPAQLHRFAGIASGRKVLIARALAEATPWADAPVPLRGLVEQIAHALRTAGTPPLSAFPEAHSPLWFRGTAARPSATAPVNGEQRRQ
jgi:hypothetical protein